VFFHKLSLTSPAPCPLAVAEQGGEGGATAVCEEEPMHLSQGITIHNLTKVQRVTLLTNLQGCAIHKLKGAARVQGHFKSQVTMVHL